MLEIFGAGTSACFVTSLLAWIWNLGGNCPAALSCFSDGVVFLTFFLILSMLSVFFRKKTGVCLFNIIKRINLG